MDGEDLRLISRLTYRRQRLTKDSSVRTDSEFENAKECSSVIANTMCSDLDLAHSWEPGWHYLMLDIDFPIEVVESSSGNSHIVFDRPLEFNAMIEIMEVMAKHGILQEEWVRSSKRKGFATLRAPGISKRVEKDFYGLNDNGEVETENEYKEAFSKLKDRKAVGGN